VARSNQVDKPVNLKVIADEVDERADLPELVHRPNAEQGVTRLLRQEPGLAAVAREAASQLVRFIPDARLTLDLLTDPEDDSGEQLFLGISTGLAEDDALAALRRFDQGWLVQHVGRARGRLCIDLSDE
jgi:hypothetical protein